MRENTDQKNFEYGYFSRSANLKKDINLNTKALNTNT